MGRRSERVGNLIRQTIGELLLSKLSDPRLDPAITSVTHVEMTDDLLGAKVYVSVMGDGADQRKTLRALQHAAGHIQKLMMRQIRLRNTPVLDFVLDTNFQKTLQTLRIIQEASDQIRTKEQAEAPSPQGEYEETP